VRCRAGAEQCIAEGPGFRCAPRGETASAASFQCDDGTDCPRGETCCESFASAERYYVCAKRSGDCKVEVCAAGGAACPKGQSCQGEQCVSNDVRASCQGRARCPLDRPRCLWRDGSGRCATPKEADAAAEVMDGPQASGVLRCTVPRDCGGGLACCTSMVAGPAQTHCATGCDLANSMQLCEADDDCRGVAPGLCGDLPGCAARVRCTTLEPDPRHPDWLKACRVAD
jgi:hypothetical protein